MLIKNNSYDKETLIDCSNKYIDRCKEHYEAFKLFNETENKWIQIEVEQLVTEVVRKSIEEFDK